MPTPIPVQNLIKPGTNMKQLYITMSSYDTSEAQQTAPTLQQELNIKKLDCWYSSTFISEIEIKFVNRPNVLMIDILVTLHKLRLTPLASKVSLNIGFRNVFNRTCNVSLNIKRFTEDV